MADPTYPFFPIMTFIGFIISLIPLPWHLQALNSGTCYYMMWAALACLNQFINSVVWAGNILNHAPIWCEISIRITMASSVALPAASLCINRRLYRIAHVQATSFSHAERSRAILIDTIICILFPLLFVALQYIVQGHRFNIFEDIGCYPALYNTLLTYFISSMWPIVIGLISATYCILTLRALSHRRLEFGQFMKSNAASLTTGRYFRLMALAMSEVLLTTPMAIFTIWLNATVSPLGPWVSWQDTHFNYSRIELFPSILWRSNHVFVMTMEFTRWVSPLCAFVFFAFFGFADEARRNYTKLYSWIMRQPVIGSGKQFFSTKDTAASLGQFTKTPMSAKTFHSTSSIPPTYSPPASFHPVVDIKQPASTEATNGYDKRFSSTEKTDTEFGFNALLAESYTRLPDHSSQKHISWKTISVPSSDRRHSSYF